MLALLVLCLLAAVLLVSHSVSSENHSGGIIDIGSRRELLIDDYLIESLSGGAHPRLHHPVRQEIVLHGDRPWEGNACGYYTVLQDGPLYRMYYKAWHIGAQGQQNNPVTICYAESRDGIHWDKPDLGLFEYNGSTHHNIVVKTIDDAPPHDFSPFMDAKPGTAADGAYKAVGLCKSPQAHGLWAFQSADGRHWQPVQKGPIFSGYVFDTQNIAFWSELEQCYVLYYRALMDNRRSINRAVSDDFIHWEDQGPLHFRNRPPTAQQEYYTNQIGTYQRAPHIYIGFPAVYRDRGWIRSTEQLPELALRRERSQQQARYGAAVTDTMLMVSRDGRDFYTWQESFLKPGLRTRHNWSYGDNYTAWHVVETESTCDDAPRELSLYATESYFTGRTSRLRRYTLRMDGFASIFADISGGELVTKPIRFSGNQLEINFATSAPGAIRVEIQTGDGQPVSGYALADCEEVFGDALDRCVTWRARSDVSVLAGKAVRLRFVLQDADLFAFRFTNDDPAA